MNDYVSKPVDPENLWRALCRWIDLNRGRSVPPMTGRPAAAPVVLPNELPGIDIATALHHVGGNRELLGSILRVFLRDHAEDSAALRAACAGGDLEQMRRKAHALKGVTGSLGAHALHAIVVRLDAALKSQPIPMATIGSLVAEVAVAFAVVLDSLRSLPSTAPDPENVPSTARAPGMQPSVLLVDDEPLILTVLRAMLKRDYAVSTAQSGEQALQMAASSPPRLIVLDVTMPDMDGYEVCRRLKASAITASIPVIFLTALDGEDEKALGRQLGAVGYLSKPVKRDQVLNCLREVLRDTQP
jgi:CheY-like chemotaxis protein